MPRSVPFEKARCAAPSAAALALALILAFVAALAAAEPADGGLVAIPPLKGSVVDAAGVLSADEIAQRAFTAWKPGRKGLDDGLLLLLAVNNPPQRTRKRSNEPSSGCFPQLDTAQSILRRMDDQTSRIRFTYR